MNNLREALRDFESYWQTVKQKPPYTSKEISKHAWAAGRQALSQNGEPVAWRYKRRESDNWKLINFEPYHLPSLFACEPLYIHSTEKP